MRKSLLIIVMTILVNSIFVQTYYAQTATAVDHEKIRKWLVKILRSDKNGIKVKMNSGKTIKGHLTAIDVDFFTLVENKSKVTKNVDFSNVKKVERYSKFFSKDNLLIVSGVGFLILYGIRGAN